MVKKVFTGVGDEGFTATWAGRKVSKDDPVIELNGAIDFLLSSLDLAKLHVEKPSIKELINYIEKKLWQLGGEVSLIGTPKSENKLKYPIIDDDINIIEKKILSLGKPPPTFVRFSTPGAVYLNECRVRSRFVERNMIKYLRTYKIRKDTYIFINRLSDLLFMMAVRLELGD